MFEVESRNNNDSRDNGADSVLYHRWWVDRISPRSSGFKSKPVYVGFVLGKKWHLDRFLSKYFQFPVSTIPQTTRTHSFVYHRRFVNLPNDDDFKKHAKNLIEHHDMKNQADVPAHPFLNFKLDID